VEATLARYARCEIASVQAAGGRDHEEGGVDWRSVADDADGVLVVAEAWEAPDRGVLRLMRELRAALDRRLPVRVLLLDTSEGTLRPPPREQVQLWREGLGRLEDPYLGVEPFREAR